MMGEGGHKRVQLSCDFLSDYHAERRKLLPDVYYKIASSMISRYIYIVVIVKLSVNSGSLALSTSVIGGSALSKYNNEHRCFPIGGS